MDVLSLKRVRPVAGIERQTPLQVHPQPTCYLPREFERAKVFLRGVGDVPGLVAHHGLGLRHGFGSRGCKARRSEAEPVLPKMLEPPQ